MLPRATENAVVGHMRPADLYLDHTGSYNSRISFDKVIYLQSVI